MITFIIFFSRIWRIHINLPAYSINVNFPKLAQDLLFICSRKAGKEQQTQKYTKYKRENIRSQPGDTTHHTIFLYSIL